MNRLEYNERIYNYKHGLVNSAGSQTIQHSVAKEEEKTTEPEVKEEPQEQEEEIEHSALGDEWDNHKYIRKIEKADGTVTYIYEDGSSRTEHNKPMATEGTGYHGGGTPGGSYGNKPKAQQTGTPGGVNGSSLTAGKVNESIVNKGGATPNGYNANYKPQDAYFSQQAKIVNQSGATPGGIYNYYNKNSGPVGDARANKGTPGSATGPKEYPKLGDASTGKGTPGGATGPSTTKGVYSAQVWNGLKNNIKEFSSPIKNSTPGTATGPSITQGKEEEAKQNIAQSNINTALDEKQKEIDNKIEIARVNGSFDPEYIRRWTAWDNETGELLTLSGNSSYEEQIKDYAEYLNNPDEYKRKFLEKFGAKNPLEPITDGTPGTATGPSLTEGKYPNLIKEEIDDKDDPNSTAYVINRFKDAEDEWEAYGVIAQQRLDSALNGDAKNLHERTEAMNNIMSALNEKYGLTYVEACDIIYEIRNDGFNNYDRDSVLLACDLIDTIVNAYKEAYPYEYEKYKN